MPQRYYGILLLFISIFSLCTGPAYGQRLRLDDVKLNGTSDFNNLPGGYHFLHHFVSTTAGPATTFRQVVLDSALHLRHQRDVHLVGRNVELLSYGTNRQAALYRFRRRQNDSLITVVIDTAGQVLSLARAAGVSHQPRLPLTLQVPSDSLFVLHEASSGLRNFRLHCLDLQQRERWKLTFMAHKHRTKLESFVADARYA